MNVLRNSRLRIVSMFIFCLVIKGKLHAQVDSSILLLSISVDSSVYQLYHIDEFRFYISEICLYRGQKIIYKDKNSGYLIDLSKEHVVDIPLLPKISTLDGDSLSIRFGLDSVKQISGVFEGDLDPIHGMYWTWNTGYIHYKLEVAPLANDDRIAHFELHLGGYSYPFYTSFFKIFPVRKNQVKVSIDVLPVIRQVEQWGLERIMRPCRQASILSRILMDQILYIP